MIPAGGAYENRWPILFDDTMHNHFCYSCIFSQKLKNYVRRCLETFSMLSGINLMFQPKFQKKYKIFRVMSCFGILDIGESGHSPDTFFLDVICSANYSVSESCKYCGCLVHVFTITAKHRNWIKMQKREKRKCRAMSKIWRYHTHWVRSGRVLIRYHENELYLPLVVVLVLWRQGVLWRPTFWGWWFLSPHWKGAAVPRTASPAVPGRVVAP